MKLKRSSQQLLQLQGRKGIWPIISLVRRACMSWSRVNTPRDTI